MREQAKKAMQALKWLSIGLFISGGIPSVARLFFKGIPANQFYMIMVLIGILGINIHTILLSVIQRLDELENKTE